ncbi:MAG: family 20 glycosylhydrolase [Pseudomonadaceae bacterium]|nr:family 20 glycosylhydrolase [Pseudomonadaceae bacterium]
MPASTPLPSAIASVFPAISHWRPDQGGVTFSALELIPKEMDSAALRRLQTAHSYLGLDGRRAGANRLPLHVSLAADSVSRLEMTSDENYTISIRAHRIDLSAPQIWGALRGLATIVQLLGIHDVPCGVIEDSPVLAWRGVMLDPARRFLPIALLEQTIDAMALCKLNVLHLHLSDDQGCRFRSERYPAIASKDASYSSEQLSGLVELAASRGVRVIAELDVPGHVSALTAGYPQWGMMPTDEPGEPSRRFGVHRECLNVARPQVRQAVEELFEELAQIFSDECIHIGGDEVSTRAWSEDATVADYLHSEGLSDVAELQPHFNRDLIEKLGKLGRRSIAWDEALADNLPQRTIIQAWRGASALERALHAGHDAILSAPYYLDLFYPLDVHTRFRPDAPVAELLSLEDELRADPRLSHIASGMAWTDHWRELPVTEPASKRGRLLGAEACLWGELVDADVLPARLWSRMVALADLFWRPRGDEVATWRTRQAEGADRMKRVLGIDWTEPPGTLAAHGLVSPESQEFAGWLEPVKWYARLLGEDALNARLMGTEMPQARPYTAETALTSLADVLPTESTAAWRLDEIVSNYIHRRDGAREELALVASRFSELAQTAEVPEYLQPLLVRLGQVGDAVSRLLNGDRTGITSVTIAAQTPEGEYMLAVAPALLRLSNTSVGDG